MLHKLIFDSSVAIGVGETVDDFIMVHQDTGEIERISPDVIPEETYMSIRKPSETGSTHLLAILPETNEQRYLRYSPICFLPLSPLEYKDNLIKQMKSEVFGPVSLDLDITEECNDRCVFCYSNAYRQRRMKENDQKFYTISKADIITVLKDFRALGTKHVRFVASGEPLLHKDFPEILYEAKKLGYIITIFSNGNKLNDPALVTGIAEYADFFRVSLDAGTEDQRKTVHCPKSERNTLENIYQGLDNVATLRLRLHRENDLRLGGHYLINTDNYTGISSMYDRTNLDSYVYSYNFNDKAQATFGDREVLEIQRQLLDIIDSTIANVFVYPELKRIIFPDCYRDQTSYDALSYQTCYAAYQIPIIEANLHMQGCSRLRGNDGQNGEVLINNTAAVDLARAWMEKVAEKKKLNVYDFCKNCCSDAVNGMFQTMTDILTKDIAARFYRLYNFPFKLHNLPRSFRS
jgi:organic radical activating enzyme